MTRRVTLLNGTFDAVTHEEAVAAVFEAMAAGRRGWVCTVNVATLMTMRANPRLQSFVDRAALVVADGQPLVWCAPLFGGRLPERVAGIDLIDPICARAAREAKGVFLLGAHGDAVAGTAERLRARHPGLRLAFADGYFDAAQAPARAASVRASGASVLFVGMGSPRQEAFIEDHWGALGVAIALGVGGSFDVLAGVRYRAHPTVRRVGLEWLIRLLQEPRRLLRRYLTTNTRFCLLVADAAAARLKRWFIQASR